MLILLCADVGVGRISHIRSDKGSDTVPKRDADPPQKSYL